MSFPGESADRGCSGALSSGVGVECAFVEFDASDELVPGRGVDLQRRFRFGPSTRTVEAADVRRRGRGSVPQRRLRGWGGLRPVRVPGGD
jgi:hypothetical protein